MKKSIQYKDLVGYTFHYTDSTGETHKYYLDINLAGRPVIYHLKNGKKIRIERYFSPGTIIESIQKNIWVIDKQYYRNLKLKRILK